MSGSRAHCRAVCSPETSPSTENRRTRKLFDPTTQGAGEVDGSVERLPHPVAAFSLQTNNGFFSNNCAGGPSVAGRGLLPGIDIP
jgi:hypothetical protein